VADRLEAAGIDLVGDFALSVLTGTEPFHEGLGDVDDAL